MTTTNAFNRNETPFVVAVRYRVAAPAYWMENTHRFSTENEARAFFDAAFESRLDTDKVLKFFPTHGGVKIIAKRRR